MKTASPLLTGATLLVSLALAAEVRITLPPETGTLRDGPGLALVQTSCLTCHSAEYISTQPPFPRAFWEASVKKMREKYGAPVAEGDVGKLVDYLAAAYGAPDGSKTPR
ncbi:MAG: cytochrome c [Chthoniobacteraceae bacterium]